jgi:peptide-methionine (S)-S-oxide reductase
MFVAVIHAAVALSGAYHYTGSFAPDAARVRPAGVESTMTGPIAAAKEARAVFAGGCFWGIQAVFEHVKGVIRATSGYAGGAAGTATYGQVSDGDTGHAESVEVIFDPAQVSYTTLLDVFFSVAHDPTQKNRQGPDVGTQYRSAIFYIGDEQKRVALAYIQQLTAAKTFTRPIVTEVTPLTVFYAAEAYHQDYAIHHPNEPYIVYNDLPKVAHLRESHPQLWRESPVTR